MKGKRKMKMASTRIWGAGFLRGGAGSKKRNSWRGKSIGTAFLYTASGDWRPFFMSQANVDLIQGLYAAFARGDGPAVLASMDPAIVWNEAENFLYADRNPYVGHAAVADGIFFRLATEWDHFQALPSEFLDAGDTVVVLGYYKAAYKATGTPLNAQFAHIWRLRDAKITAFQQYTDTAQAARAVHG